MTKLLASLFLLLLLAAPALAADEYVAPEEPEARLLGYPANTGVAVDASGVPAWLLASGCLLAIAAPLFKNGKRSHLD